GVERVSPSDSELDDTDDQIASGLGFDEAIVQLGFCGSAEARGELFDDGPNGATVYPEISSPQALIVGVVHGGGNAVFPPDLFDRAIRLIAMHLTDPDRPALVPHVFRK